MPKEHTLQGIEPDNLLGFLALLGFLRALGAEPSWSPRVYWAGLPLRPQLVLSTDVPPETLLQTAAAGCSELAKGHEFGEHADIKFTVGEARLLLKDAAGSATPSDRSRTDLLSALFSDGAAKDEDAVRPTPLCTLFGQGHQHFLERLESVPKGKPPKKLARKVSVEQLNSPVKLEQALFSSWVRSDATQSFRWDPLEDRRYALRFEDPSGDEALTVHGANRLASLAIPLLTAVPIRERGKIQLNAVATRYVPGSGVCVFWPIWSRPGTLDAISSMLATPEASLIKCGGLGVIRIYRTARISVGKYFNFTRASIHVEGPF